MNTHLVSTSWVCWRSTRSRQNSSCRSPISCFTDCSFANNFFNLRVLASTSAWRDENVEAISHDDSSSFSSLWSISLSLFCISTIINMLINLLPKDNVLGYIGYNLWSFKLYQINILLIQMLLYQLSIFFSNIELLGFTFKIYKARVIKNFKNIISMSRKSCHCFFKPLTYRGCSITFIIKDPFPRRFPLHIQKWCYSSSNFPTIHAFCSSSSCVRSCSARCCSLVWSMIFFPPHSNLDSIVCILPNSFSCTSFDVFSSSSFFFSSERKRCFSWK